jgi:hypothetical protein
LFALAIIDASACGKTKGNIKPLIPLFMALPPLEKSSVSTKIILRYQGKIKIFPTEYRAWA